MTAPERAFAASDRPGDAIALGAPDPTTPPSPAHSTTLEAQLLRIVNGARQVAARDRRQPRPDDASRYRRFLDALGVAVYTTDAEGRITFFNEAAATFWGRRPELGELWCGSLRLFRASGEPLAHDRCPMAVALREGRIVRGDEAVAERPDGSRVAFLAYPTPLHDDDGQLLGAVNVLVDVSDRRRAEDDLRRAAIALESSNAVKDEFLGLVSHELRTPVTTIFGNARLLQDRGDSLAPDVRSAMVADIAADAGRLHEIIENLLYLTRLGAGPQPDLEPQVIERIVRRSVQSFRRRHPTFAIRFDSPPTGVIVEADRMWLELVVENLLNNAAKYSPPQAPIEVAVNVGATEVEVAVLDRGIGLADADSAALFEPFYRGDQARMTANGIGVGLAVCDRIVKALGGRMSATSRPGGGAAVAFMLPVAELVDDEVGPAA